MKYKTREVAEYIALPSTRSGFVRLLQDYFGFSKDDSQDVYSKTVFEIYSFSLKNGGISLDFANLEGYFRASVFNEAKSFIKDGKRNSFISLNELEEKVGGNSFVFEDDSFSHPEYGGGETIENLIIKLAENLSSDYKKIIFAYLDNPSMSYKEIRNLFDENLSENTVKTKIRRARKRMREEAKNLEELSEKISLSDED